jgi:predicted ATP-binding protein involved in virulence
VVKDLVMIIEKVNIRNFRCFKEYELSFAPQITVLIGKNGTGKTNLIAALKKGMSFIFSKNKVVGQQNISTSGDLHISKFETMDARYDTEKRDFVYENGVVIKCDGVFQNKKISWELYKGSQKGSLLTTKYQEASQTIQNYYNQDTANVPMPILAFFSDSYPHKKISFGSYAKSILKMEGPLPRNFGYYMWDAETNCAEIWQDRYVKVNNSYNDFKKTHDEKSSKELEEIDFIDKRIIAFTKPLEEGLEFINSEFEINKIFVTRPKDGNYQIQFEFKNERKMFFDNLPQGYNRLLSIVFDIAYRNYILNGTSEPTGIVFIDEVELHLHPTLAQEVLGRLHKTFPLVQFIVSTHSPLVISNLKQSNGENKVIKLINEGLDFKNETVENIYGVDYITTLMVMDSKYRISTIDKLIDAYVSLKTRNKENEANAIRVKLDEIVGFNNRLIEEEINKKIKANQ